VFVGKNRSHPRPESEKKSRERRAIDHSKGWTEDRGDDGKQEIHVHKIEGIWASLRNQLRLFRGLRKDRLSGCVAMFELALGCDHVSPEVLQCPPPT